MSNKLIVLALIGILGLFGLLAATGIVPLQMAGTQQPSLVQYTGNPQKTWFTDQHLTANPTVTFLDYELSVGTSSRIETVACKPNTCNGISPPSIDGEPVLDEYGCQIWNGEVKIPYWTLVKTDYAPEERHGFYCCMNPQAMWNWNECPAASKCYELPSSLRYSTWSQSYETRDTACGGADIHSEWGCAYTYVLKKNNEIIKQTNINTNVPEVINLDNAEIQLFANKWFSESQTCDAIQNQIMLKIPQDSFSIDITDMQIIDEEMLRVYVSVENTWRHATATITAKTCQPTFFGDSICKTVAQDIDFPEGKTETTLDIPLVYLVESLSVYPSLEVKATPQQLNLHGLNIDCYKKDGTEPDGSLDAVDDCDYIKLAVVNGDPATDASIQEELQHLRDKIDYLEKTLQDKIDYIKQLTDNIEEQARLVNELELNLQEKAVMVSQLQSEIDNQAELISQLTQKRDEQAEIINNLQINIQEQAEIIQQLSDKNEEQAKIIDELNLNIEEKAQLISDLTSEVDKQAAIIDNLNMNLQEKAELIRQLTATNEEQAALIKQMKLSFAEQADIINALNQKVEDDAALIHDLSSSTDEQAQIIINLRRTVQEDAELIKQLKLANQEQAELIAKLQLKADEQADLIKQLTANIDEMAEIIKNMRLSLDKQSEIIDNLKLTIKEDAELIAKLNLKLEEEAKIIANLKLTIEEQKQVIDNMPISDNDKDELKNYVESGSNWFVDNWVLLIVVLLSAAAAVVLAKKL